MREEYIKKVVDEFNKRAAGEVMVSYKVEENKDEVFYLRMIVNDNSSAWLFKKAKMVFSEDDTISEAVEKIFSWYGDYLKSEGAVRSKAVNSILSSKEEVFKNCFLHMESNCSEFAMTCISNVPNSTYFMYLDFIVVLMVNIPYEYDGRDCMVHYIVGKDLLKRLGITAEELISRARMNTLEQELLIDELGCMEEEELEEAFFECHGVYPESEQVELEYMLRNMDFKCYCMSSVGDIDCMSQLFVKEKLEQFAGDMQSDVLVLPIGSNYVCLIPVKERVSALMCKSELQRAVQAYICICVDYGNAFDNAFDKYTSGGITGNWYYYELSTGNLSIL